MKLHSKSIESNHRRPFQIKPVIPHFSQAKIQATPFEWCQHL
jgi:hypothetical protein